jgi:endo-1,4-beta-xylanase
VLVGVWVSVLVAAGCGQSSTNSPGGTGGSGAGTGGRTSSATGGSAATGGATGSGGTTATGGARSSGGSSGSGGTASGGDKGSGGVVIDAAAGGSSGGDGAVVSGGSSGTGGATGEGGKGSGGVTSTGGVPGIDGGKPSDGPTGTGGSKTCGTTAASLRAAAECTGRLIGAALSSQHINESGYATAAKEFNYVTCENEMKWDQIEPQKGQYSWNAADQIVSFATTNNMKVKGHTLVWYNQLPSWVQSLNSETAVRDAMVAHIKGVMQHFKGKVAVWDVVNEAVSIEGTSYRDCPFYKYLGKTYIDEAFKTAREVDSTVKLYYNDYNDEGLNAKSDFVYELLKGLKERGVPIDGVGMQMHYGKPNDTFTIDDLKANIKRLADLGLEVVFSEMDVHRCGGMTEAQQVTLYHDLVAACVGEPQCKAVTFWGLTDKYSWLNDYSPLGCSGSKPLGDLWDDSFKKKPAYTGVLNALLGI